MDEVISAIETQNTQAASGTLGKRPSSSNEPFQYSTRVKGRLTTTQEFGNIVVRAKQGSGFIRVKDIARIELGSEDYNYESMVNNHQAIGFGVKLTSDANALDTITNVKKVLKNASQNFPDGVEYKIVVDNTDFVRESLYRSCENIF